MLVLAPMIILLQARPFICKQNKCIQFRQHHILMNIRIITKKRKYLIIQLACASSSNWSSMYSSRGCGCNNGIDVLITWRLRGAALQALSHAVIVNHGSASGGAPPATCVRSPGLWPGLGSAPAPDDGASGGVL